MSGCEAAANRVHAKTAQSTAIHEEAVACYCTVSYLQAGQTDPDCAQWSISKVALYAARAVGMFVRINFTVRKYRCALNHKVAAAAA
jgi:hypothetical protein